MTTIAWDGKTLAADRNSVYSDIRRTDNKIHRCGEYVYGASGCIPELVLVAEWLTRGASDTDRPYMQGIPAVFGLAIHASTRRAFVVQGVRPVLTPVLDPFTATGSGAAFAISAMYFGKCARDAVQFASVYDVYTGGSVDTVDIDGGGQ